MNVDREGPNGGLRLHMLWMLLFLNREGPNGGLRLHMLWMLLFLKCISIERMSNEAQGRLRK